MVPADPAQDFDQERRAFLEQGRELPFRRLRPRGAICWSG